MKALGKIMMVIALANWCAAPTWAQNLEKSESMEAGNNRTELQEWSKRFFHQQTQFNRLANMFEETFADSIGLQAIVKFPNPDTSYLFEDDCWKCGGKKVEFRIIENEIGISSSKWKVFKQLLNETGVKEVAKRGKDLKIIGSGWTVFFMWDDGVSPIYNPKTARAFVHTLRDPLGILAANEHDFQRLVTSQDPSVQKPYIISFKLAENWYLCYIFYR